MYGVNELGAVGVFPSNYVGPVAAATTTTTLSPSPLAAASAAMAPAVAAAQAAMAPLSAATVPGGLAMASPDAPRALHSAALETQAQPLIFGDRFAPLMMAGEDVVAPLASAEPLAPSRGAAGIERDMAAQWFEAFPELAPSRAALYAAEMDAQQLDMAESERWMLKGDTPVPLRRDQLVVLDSIAEVRRRRPLHMGPSELSIKEGWQGVGFTSLRRLSSVKTMFAAHGQHPARHVVNSSDAAPKRDAQPCLAFELNLEAAAFNTCSCGWAKTAHAAVPGQAKEARARAQAQATAELARAGPGARLLTSKGWMPLEDVIVEMQASSAVEDAAAAAEAADHHV